VLHAAVVVDNVTDRAVTWFSDTSDVPVQVALNIGGEGRPLVGLAADLKSLAFASYSAISDPGRRVFQADGAGEVAGLVRRPHILVPGGSVSSSQHLVITPNDLPSASGIVRVEAVLHILPEGGETVRSALGQPITGTAAVSFRAARPAGQDSLLSQASVLDSFVGAPLVSSWLGKQSNIVAARIGHATGLEGPWLVSVRSNTGSINALVDDRTGTVSPY